MTGVRTGVDVEIRHTAILTEDIQSELHGTIGAVSGTQMLVERSDPAQGAVLRAWLDQSVAPAFKSRVLPVDERVARRVAGLHLPGPALFRDALIGATALVHDMTVVTRNLEDFQRFDELDVINPWS